MVAITDAHPTQTSQTISSTQSLLRQYSFSMFHNRQFQYETQTHFRSLVHFAYRGHFTSNSVPVQPPVTCEMMMGDSIVACASSRLYTIGTRTRARDGIGEDRLVHAHRSVTAEMEGANNGIRLALFVIKALKIIVTDGFPYAILTTRIS
jgi:hypothetical protein